MNLATSAFSAALGLVILAVGVGSVPSIARADTCWDHNGSMMRLRTEGDKFWFSYDRPKRSLHRAGVRQGTLLFDGIYHRGNYTGIARRFSRYCPGTPSEYQVSGPVASGQQRIVVTGERQIHKRCRPTGKYEIDRLVFTFRYQC